MDGHVDRGRQTGKYRPGVKIEMDIDINVAGTVISVRSFPLTPVAYRSFNDGYRLFAEIDRDRYLKPHLEQLRLFTNENHQDRCGWHWFNGYRTIWLDKSRLGPWAVGTSLGWGYDATLRVVR